MPTQAEPDLEAPAFQVDGIPVTWSEVVDEARRRGSWQAVQRAVWEGMACLAQDRASGHEPSGAVVREEAARFRQERRLTAAEDMESWLDRWSLTVADWMDHVRRTLARDAHRDDAAELARRQPPGEDGMSGSMWASAVCSGALERVAAELAGALAVRAALVETRAGPPDEDSDAAMARFRTAVLTPERLDTELGSRPLDWVRLDTTALSFRTEDAAREARLCVVDDGLAPEELAGSTGAAHADRHFYLEDVDHVWRSALLGTHPGEVVGPLAGPVGWTLLVIRRRSAPSVTDPEVRERAEAALVARAVRKETDDRVVWSDD
ncbi:MAG: hypothetical protein L0I76_13095 [Pseudonocardia sp.]|nr:hypothetical protein [Pseudonocardia sp.]